MLDATAAIAERRQASTRPLGIIRMKNREKYGLYLVATVAVVYVLLQTNLNYSFFSIQTNAQKNSREYDSKIEEQTSINSAINRSIQIRHSDTEKSIWIIDSLINTSDKTLISKCNLINYKLRYLIETNQLSKAETALEKYHMRCKHRSAESNLVDAVIQLNNGKIDEAIKRLQIAKKKNPKYSWYLANVYEIQGELKKAKDEYLFFNDKDSNSSKLAQDRLTNMNKIKLNNVIYLNDLKEHNFFNIKPLFYQGTN